MTQSPDGAFDKKPFEGWALMVSACKQGSFTLSYLLSPQHIVEVLRPEGILLHPGLWEDGGQIARVCAPSPILTGRFSVDRAARCGVQLVLQIVANRSAPFAVKSRGNEHH